MCKFTVYHFESSDFMLVVSVIIIVVGTVIDYRHLHLRRHLHLPDTNEERQKWEPAIYTLCYDVIIY